jgi:V/A-type H+-transporting ATPase subunit E
MTGLEKILSQIEYESDNRCRELIDKANQNAETILEQAQSQADRIKEVARTESERKLEASKQAAESAAQLAASREILKAKLEIIDSTLERSLEVIKALPKKEYFEILKELILKNARKGEGVLHLSKADTDKLPVNFVDAVNNAFKKGYKIVLGDSVDIDSGFILVYGDIDINCSFDAIAAEKRDELRDALNGLLFD